MRCLVLNLAMAVESRSMESASRWALDHLARFAAPVGPDMRPTLLRVLTELYVQKPAHTAAEERHYTELAVRLLDAADVSTRAAVAQRLAHYKSPPRRVVERLASDIANLKGQRPALRSSGATMLNGEHQAQSRIAVHIATTLDELFFAANSDERRLILLNMDVIAPLAVGPVQMSGDDRLSARLEAAVLSRNREAFAQQLAQALHISRSQARRIADDDLGEPIVAAAKALKIRRGALYRILLFVNIGRSVARLQALSELHHQLASQSAEHMVAIWQSLPKVDGPAKRHQPMLCDDKVVTRSRTISAIAHHAAVAPPAKREAL